MPKRPKRIRHAAFASVILLGAACTSALVPVSDTEDTEGGSSTGDGSTTEPETPLTSSTSGMNESSSSSTGFSSEASSSSGEPEVGPMCSDGTPNCVEVDLVVVVDNSRTMLEEQRILARQVPQLLTRLQSLESTGGVPLAVDLNVLVTSTDLSNPECTQFKPEGYTPARGAPVATPCTTRLEGFNPPGSDFDAAPLCEDYCPTGLAPSGSFLHVGPDGNNAPDVPAADINGDDVQDDAASQTLSCLVPQGVGGCGFESPLEAGLQALNPGATWNTEEGFLRSGSVLALAIFTDEYDCSVRDFSMMMDESIMSIDPSSGEPKQTSAMCWREGALCDGPDTDGEFDCEPRAPTRLHAVDRYTRSFAAMQASGHQVVMLGVLGIPRTEARSPDRPWHTTEGGIHDLQVRVWEDGAFPEGDLPPDEANAPMALEEFIGDFAVAPGCANFDGVTGDHLMALPPSRIAAVCSALDDEQSGADGLRCCLESICTSNLDGAFSCLAGVIENAAHAE